MRHDRLQHDSGLLHELRPGFHLVGRDGDEPANLFGGFDRRERERAHFLRDDGKAAARVAGACGFDPAFSASKLVCNVISSIVLMTDAMSREEPLIISMASTARCIVLPLPSTSVLEALMATLAASASVDILQMLAVTSFRAAALCFNVAA